MESLRRLTSCIFSETGRVNLGKFQPPDTCSLELTFMTEQLVVMGTPYHGVTEKKQNVVNVNDLAQYLDTFHRSHFMLFNLNLFEDAAEFEADKDKQSIVDKLHEQIA
ncbi:unnamed protein product [Peronospora destructor]|uniref:Uncharacterized protein n=1 Tax=Peronospora destructor TaxID=86335 RepID=A0AAV0VF08_9STRA|nr:unnamed protein product [Peronospora destructor]